MSSIAVGSDNIRGKSKDSADLQKFIDKLKSAGHTVTNTGVGPNTVQRYMTKSSHSCDIMIQIAGGLCIGTLGDFIKGIKQGYYHAKKGAIVYNMVANSLNAKTWKAVKAHDWYYSMSTVTPYLGKTLPQVYSENKDTLVGFADGENIDEVITNFMKAMGGGTTTTGNTTTQSAGSSCFDLIKQVCSDWDVYGVDFDLRGDTVVIKKTNPTNATQLSPKNIVNNSLNFTDYDRNTPNVNGNAKDQYLIDRFGQVPLETEVTDQQAQVLQMSQRGHNHSIDCKTIVNPHLNVGSWVNLNVPELGIKDRKYYIAKSTYQEERVVSLTLDVAPPSLYIEITETATEEVTDESTETTEEEA